MTVLTWITHEVYPGSYVKSKDGKTILTVFNEQGFVWIWNKKLRAGVFGCCWTEAMSPIRGTLHPITENPKVRDFDYEVDLIHFGSPKAWIDFQANGTKVDVASLLYEFQEKNSKALAKFYNPRNPE